MEHAEQMLQTLALFIQSVLKSLSLSIFVAGRDMPIVVSGTDISAMMMEWAMSDKLLRHFRLKEPFRGPDRQLSEGDVRRH